MMKRTKLPRVQVSVDDAIHEEMTLIQTTTGLAKATILTMLVREAVAARRAYRLTQPHDARLVLVGTRPESC